MPDVQRILALDPATNTGIAWTDDLCQAARFSSVVSFGKAPSRGRKLIAFQGWVAKKIDETKPDLVVYERPQLRHLTTARLLLGFIGMIEAESERARVPYIEVRADRIKKHATGKGNAKKPQMIEAARAKGWSIRSDDEADALHLLDLACLLIKTGELEI